MTSDLKIDELDPGTAVNILQRLATADPDYAGAASETAALSLPPLSPSQQAELAKHTLLVLAEDPQRAQAISMLAQERGAQRFDGGFTSAAFLVCVVALLRTHVEYHRNPGGTSKLKIIHKPIDSKLLTELLKKISSLLPGGV
jgi:hypothetical protein